MENEIIHISIENIVDTMVVDKESLVENAKSLSDKFCETIFQKLNDMETNGKTINVEINHLIGKSEIITLLYDNKSLLKLRLGKSWWHLSVEEREKIELDFETVLKQVETMLQSHKSE